MTPTQLIAWRVQNRLTQPRLAEMLKVAPRTVQRWEAGKTAIPGDLQARIATFKESAFGSVEEDPIITFNTHPHLYEPWHAKRGAVRLPAHPDYGKPRGVPYDKARVSALATYVPPTPEELARRDAEERGSLGNFLQALADKEDD